MRPLVLSVNPVSPEAGPIGRAAGLLRGGGLVAFPTETVYGLGAAALDAAAVGRIFAAKGRPPTNPLIVHVASADAASAVVADWPAAAGRLAARFWPGPLTLVLSRSAAVPDVVTAGGLTVAVRVPAHPVALALLRKAGVPVAAPSANRSAHLSPTTAEHVVRSLGDAVDLVLDGGPTPGGIESTVLDLTADPPRLLRPGLIPLAELEGAIGPVVPPTAAGPGPLRSPGQLARHYAPRTPLEVVEGDGANRVAELAAAGAAVGWLRFGVAAEAPAAVRVVVMPEEPAAFAARLYAELHRLDDETLDRLVVELPPDRAEWLAVRDRLRRAAASG